MDYLQVVEKAQIFLGFFMSLIKFFIRVLLGHNYLKYGRVTLQNRQL
jgi:hypothetical protein